MVKRINPVQVLLELVGGPWDGTAVAVAADAIVKAGAYLKITDCNAAQIYEYVFEEAEQVLRFVAQRRWRPHPYRGVAAWQVGGERVRFSLRQSPRHYARD